MRCLSYCMAIVNPGEEDAQRYLRELPQEPPSNQVGKLSDQEVHRLDEIDRAARTAARKQGHSHAIAKKPALRADGRAIGRCQP